MLQKTNFDWCLLISHHKTIAIGTLVFKQEINIPMGIDPVSYWENRFLYFFESKHVQ